MSKPWKHAVARALCLPAAAFLLCGSAALAATAATSAEAQQILSLAAAQGGLIVQLGCGDGQRTVELRPNDGFIVQGLDTSGEKVAQARQRILDRGLYGPVSAREYDGRNLPFVDGSVNVLVLDDPAKVSDDEMLRVLCPKGSICRKQNGKWTAQTKPWPADLDEWTHYQHDPQGTMVGKDRVVGPPKHIQWVGDPKWLRNHDFMSSLHAMVSAGGRIFYIVDEGLRNHVFLPAHWTLIARDAFNGTVLWKVPLKDWHPSNWPLKSGPGYLPRRLVAVGDRVYVTLGLLEPTTAIDAATGKTVQTYEGTKTTEEIAVADGILYLLVDPGKKPIGYKAQSSGYGEINYANSNWGWSTKDPERSMMAVDAQSGKTLWKHAAKIAPLTPTVGENRVYFFNGDRLIALDRQTGEKVWESDSPHLKFKPATGPDARVILSDDTLVLCYATQVWGFSADTGKLLWEGKIPPTGHHSPSDLFVINGLVWSAHTGAAQEKGTHFIALDLHKGNTAKDFVAENIAGFPMHPRCYPGRATEQYIMLPGMGTEFYKVGGTKVDVHDYIRGSCIYGMMPSNGLLYKPPDTCACYYMSKLEDLCALAPAREGSGFRVQGSGNTQSDRLERGPAYDQIHNPQSKIQNPSDWPMYRHDAQRTSAGTSSVPAELKKAWQVKLGGKLTQPVVAGGRAYVASIDADTLYALDAASGKLVWKKTVGGRIDSPPTIHQGLVLFGSADGRVYCLRADDGALVWRFLVAPGDQQIISYQQPESVWPVHGSVLVYNNVVYALAGRNLFFDGGMRLVRLDPNSGKKLSEEVLDENDPRNGKNLQLLIQAKKMPVANADLLSCDGKFLYMAAQRFDLDGKRTEFAPLSTHLKGPEAEGRHVFCPTGMLDDVWYHRSYLIYGETCGEGWADYNVAQKEAPCGRMLAIAGTRAYGFRADSLGNNLLPTPIYRLYAADTELRTSPMPEAPAKKVKGAKGKKAGDSSRDEDIAGGYKVYWQMKSPPLLVNAMAVAGENLFIAGPPDVADESKMLGYLPGADDDINRQLRDQETSWHGQSGTLLWAVSANSGKKLAEYRLESVPIFDGLSAAEGKLFLSMQDGEVSCWGK